MVKIAAVGGTGSTFYYKSTTPQLALTVSSTDIATELLRAPIRSGNHEITIFTRSEPPTTQTPGVSYQQVNYHDLPGLTRALEGFDTCLSFLVAHLDEGNICQKNLIEACIASKVRRFAPSEWSIVSNSGVPGYANKDIIAAYLHEKREKNELGDLQYCLFQPSVFADYFAHPYPLSPGLQSWPLFVDFENRRAMVLDDGNYPMVVTPVSEASEVLELALSDHRPWPAVGGMQGCKTTNNEIVALGKKIRGGEWTIEYVKSEDIENGELKTSWIPFLTHPAIPVENREAFSKQFAIDFFKAMKIGAWEVGYEWNKRFPEYKPMGLEEYLRKAWEGKK
jgi:hypothetical protein